MHVHRLSNMLIIYYFENKIIATLPAAFFFFFNELTNSWKQKNNLLVIQLAAKWTYSVAKYLTSIYDLFQVAQPIGAQN